MGNPSSLPSQAALSKGLDNKQVKFVEQVLSAAKRQGALLILTCCQGGTGQDQIREVTGAGPMVSCLYCRHCLLETLKAGMTFTMSRMVHHV